MKCHRIFKFRFFIIQLSGLLINQQKKDFAIFPQPKEGQGFGGEGEKEKRKRKRREKATFVARRWR